jgi:rocB protein, putative
MEETIQKIFDETLRIESITNSVVERDIEDYLENRISQIPYFKDHPELYGSSLNSRDPLQRRVI